MKKESETTNVIEEIQFDYFHGMEADQYSFYRIPKLFFTTKYFKKLSCEARILYGLMLNRMSLSIKNRWLDEYDHVYIIFTVEDIMELMDCSRQKAVKTLAELDTDKGMGLIEKKRKKLKKQFDEQLTEPQKTLLEDYLTELLIKAGYEQREYFLEGIETGIRIVSEAFSMHNPF